MYYLSVPCFFYLSVPCFFVKYPIIETKYKPLLDKGEVFLIASIHLLHEKITSGLYYYLIDRFNEGGRKNKFKERFGFVFQEYVGELLKYYFKDWEIIPEIKYKKEHKNIHDTVDWFIKKDNKLIMIEVKQSSIFLSAKQNPTMEQIVSDLKKTIIKARKQLDKTENDIKSKKYPELSIFNKIALYEKLVVVNDPLFNANFLVKNILQCKKMPFQIININDFETLIESQCEAESLFDILSFKAIENDETDFKEYIHRIFPEARSDVKFLTQIWDDFFKKIGVPD